MSDKDIETISGAENDAIMMFIQMPRAASLCAVPARVTDLSISAMIESARLAILALPALLSVAAWLPIS